MQAKLYFHSPFSEERIYSNKDKALLLSFALSELFACMSESSSTWRSSSYEEKAHDAPLNKLQEHTNLLLVAFSDHKESLFELKEKISRLVFFISRSLPFNEEKLLQELFALLEPLIQECKEDKQLLLFLLKNQEKLVDPSYLLNLFGNPHEFCDHFQKKGFPELRADALQLLEKLQNKVNLL